MQENIKKIVNIRYILLFIVALIFMVAINYAKDTVTTKEITYNQFINLLEKNQISKVVITNENLMITPSENNEEYKGKTLYTANIDDKNLASQLVAAGVDFEGRNIKENPSYNFIFSWIMPFIIIFLIWKYFRVKKENQYLLIQIRDLLENKDK